MKQKGHFSRQVLLISAGTILAGWSIWSFTGHGKISETVIQDHFIISRSEIVGRVLTNNVRQIYDRSIAGISLFSKQSTDQQHLSQGENLWLQETNGHERYIAKNIVRASFSPDGQKISYATTDGDLFIETLKGKRLVRLARACDPAWGSDSASVTFSAVPALDYPDLQETVIYDLNSGQIVRSSNGD